MARRKNINLELDVDERTNQMSDAALVCRTWGHKWERRSVTPRQARQMLAMGLIEYDRFCENGCGSTWRQLWSIRERMIVENERRYPSSGEYLLPPNTGRLRRNEAWAANFQREFAALL